MSARQARSTYFVNAPSLPSTVPEISNSIRLPCCRPLPHPAQPQRRDGSIELRRPRLDLMPHPIIVAVHTKREVGHERKSDKSVLGRRRVNRAAAFKSLELPGGLVRTESNLDRSLKKSRLLSLSSAAKELTISSPTKRRPRPRRVLKSSGRSTMFAHLTLTCTFDFFHPRSFSSIDSSWNLSSNSPISLSSTSTSATSAAPRKQHRTYPPTIRPCAM